MTTMPVFPTTDDIVSTAQQGYAGIRAAVDNAENSLMAAIGRFNQAYSAAQQAVVAHWRNIQANPATTPAQQRAVMTAQNQLDNLAQQGQQQAAAGDQHGLDDTINQLNRLAATNPAPAPAPAAPVATTPGQPAQAQPPAPAAPVATTPAAGSNTPANLWFVGAHPNPQPISPVGTDTWGRQVNDALDNHRDGMNDLNRRVSSLESMITGVTGGRSPNWSVGGAIGVIVGFLVGFWAFSENEQTLVFAIITGGITALVVAVITALIFATTRSKPANNPSN